MSIFFLLILIAMCAAILLWCFHKRERMLQIPFFYAAVFSGWVIPQLVAVSNNENLPEGASERTIFMGILCLMSTCLGYYINKKKARLFNWNYDYKSLLYGAALLNAFGFFFFYKISQLAAGVMDATGGQWSGIITIYVFLAGMLSYGTAIAMVLYVRTLSVSAFLVMAPGIYLYLERIVIRGRRAAMVELGLMIVLALWFNRNIFPSRLLMILMVSIGALVVSSIGDYRAVMTGSDRTTWSGAGISQVFEIDFLGNFKSATRDDGGHTELTNAAMSMAAAERELQFDFGLSLWNEFVHRFVPAQFLGADFKKSLKYSGVADPSKTFGYYPHVGTTFTGLSDAFLSFWYFGAIKFYLIGMIMSRWYKAAKAGSISAQLILILSMSYALHAVTHDTQYFFLNFIQLAIFLIPVLWFSRDKNSLKYSRC